MSRDVLEINNPLPKTLFPFICHFLKPYRFVGGIFIFLGILAGFWGPFNSMLMSHVINILPQVRGGDTSILNFPAVLIVLNFIVFDNFTWRGIGYLNYRYQPVIKNKIIQETLESVLNESYQFFQDNLSGRISNQITMLADSIEVILHRISLDFVRGLSLLVVSFVTSFYVNPMFFYTLALWFVTFSSFSIWMSKHLVYLADEHARSESLLSGQLVDTIANHNNVRIFSQRTFELLRMEKFFEGVQKAFRAKEKFRAILSSIQGAMIAVMMGFVIYFLIHFYGQGLVSIGDFALMIGLSMQLEHMMWFTMARVDEFNQALGKSQQSLSALKLSPNILDKVGAKPLECTQGKITFNNVTFCYKNSPTLFQNRSVTLEGGQKVGLVGYSGGGKSTFVNLILRLYDTVEGNILIDGQDIREVTQASLRSNIAMIPQDPLLFHRSLKDNIRYSRISASDTEVVEASKRAHAHEFIVKLSQGYESLVGEHGVKLSGGQRQRIAIARAILKDAPILILDEATSQLDSVIEGLIQESLWELMQGKTTIVIAHRLSTLLNMDRILVFDEGDIIEDGTHTQLLAQAGLYKTLWDTQVGGFLQDSKSLNFTPFSV